MLVCLSVHVSDLQNYGKDGITTERLNCKLPVVFGCLQIQRAGQTSVACDSKILREQSSFVWKSSTTYWSIIFVNRFKIQNL
jgi:hypothetical protein